VDLADLAVRCDWDGESDRMPGTRYRWMTALVTSRAVFVSAARKIQSTWVRAASARGSATSQAWSGGNLLPAVQCRHVGGGQAGIPALLVRHPSRAVVDEAVTEHLVDGIVNGLVAHLEHRQQVLT